PAPRAPGAGRDRAGPPDRARARRRALLRDRRPHLRRCAPRRRDPLRGLLSLRPDRHQWRRRGRHAACPPGTGDPHPSRRAVNAEELGKRFARLVTDAVVRRPVLWRLFRAPLRFQFQKLAPGWDGRRSPARVEAYEAALAAMPATPRRALDLGTGTGDGTFALARRFPEAAVVGAELAPAVVPR